jgi:hypothetical protein
MAFINLEFDFMISSFIKSTKSKSIVINLYYLHFLIQALHNE